MVTIVNPVSDSEADEVINSTDEAFQTEPEGQDSEAYEPKCETEVAIGEAGNDFQEEGSPLDSSSEIITQEAKEESAIANEDDVFFERLRIIAELKEAKDNLSESQDRMANLVAERKDAKADVEFYQEMVNKLIEKLLKVDKPPVPKIDNRKPVEGTATPLAKVEAPAHEVLEKAEEEAIDNSWREIKTQEVLKDVKGMGKKKMEALVDLYPTLGHLEDLRDQASRGFFQFNEKLPDGFGPTVADKIQEAIGDAMIKWSMDKGLITPKKEVPSPGSDFSLPVDPDEQEESDDEESEDESEVEDDSEIDSESDSDHNYDDL